MALFSKPNLINTVWSSGGDRVAPDTVKISTGWLAEIPPRQYFNFIDWKQDQMLAYINQHGIVEWDNETEYHANKSFVQGSDGNIYQCLTTGVNIDPVVDQSDRWRRVGIEEAPRDGRQFVRRNHAWQELDSTAFAPAVHTHTIDQIIGLQNALNNKVSITGTNPTLNSTGDISLRITSTPSDSSNIVVGRTGSTDNWYLGKGSSSSNNITLHSYLLNTTLTLQSDRVVANRDLYVGTNRVFHQGNFNPDSKLSTGLAVLLNSTAGQRINANTSAILQLNSINSTANYIQGQRAGTNQWWLGSDGTNIDAVFHNYRHGTGLTLRANDVYVNKAFVSTGNVTAFSDERLKNFEGELVGSWDKIREVNSFYYKWNDKAPDTVSKEDIQIGFSAQEVQKQFPEIVHESSDGILSVDYGRFSVILLDVVKQLQERVESLEERLKGGE